jgi:hypothetical protein
MVIHDIQMKDVSPGIKNCLRVIAKTGKIGGK